MKANACYRIRVCCTCSELCVCVLHNCTAVLCLSSEMLCCVYKSNSMLLSTCGAAAVMELQIPASAAYS